MNHKNIKTLDGIRGLAVLTVLVAHYLKDVDYFWPEMKYMGQIGVMIFFSLSGYLMMLVTKEKIPTYENIKVFLYKRLSRVYPLFIVVILGSFFISLLIQWGVLDFPFYFKSIDDASSVIKHLLLINGGNSVLWSIGVEISFYFIFPIIWLASHKGSCWFILTIVVFCFFQILSNYKYEQEINFSRLNLHIHFFLIGCFSFWFCNNFSTRFISGKITLNFMFFIALVFLVFSLPITYSVIFNDDAFYNFKNMWVDNFFAMLAVALLLISSQSSMSNVIFGGKVICFFGNISYSLYLTHRVIQIAFDHYLLNFSDLMKVFSLLFFIVPLCTIVGYLSYRFIENPTRRYLYNK